MTDSWPPSFFAPPLDIHPDNAIFYARTLPRPLTWQRRDHLMHRRLILTRIGQLLLSQEAGSRPECSQVWALARKMEMLVFLHAASLLEYVNTDSLVRRLQALAAGIINKIIRRRATRKPLSTWATEGAAGPMSAAIYPASASEGTGRDFGPSFTGSETPSVVSGGSVCPHSCIAHVIHPKNWPETTGQQHVDAKQTNKRKLAAMLQAEELETKQQKKHKGSELGMLLFQGYEEVSRGIWSYVDGKQIMRSRRVCRIAAVLAPLFVTSLQLSCNAVQNALATRTGEKECILRKCVHLRQLEIVSLSAGMTFGKVSMRATNCPQRFVVTHDDHEQIVLAVAEQMRLNTFAGLTRLSITCLFTNEEANGEADVLLNTLMLGCCPRVKELCLPGNSFGDYGATKVAQMLRSQVCPELTRLDLRRNFIGEDGVRSLCHALAEGCAPNITELCLGGNTITDSSFHHVLFAMESGQLRRLRFLGIEMNYLTSRSMAMLGRTVGKLVCPVLSQISYSDNSVSNESAKRLIAAAVYQERAKCHQRIHDGISG